MTEGEAVEGFEEMDGVAGFAAVGGHTAPKPFGRGNDEIRVFLVVMEWAEAGPVTALLFECDAPGLDEGDEVGVGREAGDSGVGNAGHGFGLSIEC